MRQDAVTRDRRYGPLTAKRSEGRKEGRSSDVTKINCCAKSRYNIIQQNNSRLELNKKVQKPLHIFFIAVQKNNSEYNAEREQQ